jgi:tetratricopeptide (TPR) repeat protein
MKSRLLLLILALAGSPLSWALDQADQERLSGIQQRWAHIQYQLPETQRAAAFEKLADEAEALTREQPQVAEAWIWSGIVSSSWAAASGGLGALDRVKRARASLERALSIDPGALQGAAYTSLAVLYERVPGWPLAFGDADKAEALLQQALRINPGGIDCNYFWADHLYRKGRYLEARAALSRAMQAASRPGRELADQGRRGEIATLLKAIKEKQD